MRIAVFKHDRAISQKLNFRGVFEGRKTEDYVGFYRGLCFRLNTIRLVLVQFAVVVNLARRLTLPPFDSQAA